MLTNLKIKNFKLLSGADIPLGQTMVFIGPNNMGKTTALQALTLWEVGLRAWIRKYGTNSAQYPRKRPGVSINRKDLMSIPVPSALFLWNKLHVRNSSKDADTQKQRTENVLIEIEVSGIQNGQSWQCAIAFDYANEESLYCRLLTTDEASLSAAKQVYTAFLPSMSGLVEQEYIRQPGEINVLIGQGQTAQVLRNLCLNVSKNETAWQKITGWINKLFGITLEVPQEFPERSEITMSYKDADKKRLDLSCGGRGFHQTLLLLTYLYSNPGHVLLLDEPDAHLEILRQRQIFDILCEVADELSSQVILASHSEVILKSAAVKSDVVAFVGTPHMLNGNDGKTDQVLKSLRDIGFDQFYLAEQCGWVLYLEDETDLDILRAFAKLLNHPAATALVRPFFHPIGSNVPQHARSHFFGLREAKQNLRGIMLLDHIDQQLQDRSALMEAMWARREIENYFSMPSVLIDFVSSQLPNDLFGNAERSQRIQAMEKAIEIVQQAYETLHPSLSIWSDTVKASDEVLDPIFAQYSKQIGSPLVLRKREYHKLVAHMNPEMVAPEVKEKLDLIGDVAGSGPSAS